MQICYLHTYDANLSCWIRLRSNEVVGVQLIEIRPDNIFPISGCTMLMSPYVKCVLSFLFSGDRSGTDVVFCGPFAHVVCSDEVVV